MSLNKARFYSGTQITGQFFINPPAESPGNLAGSSLKFIGQDLNNTEKDKLIFSLINGEGLTVTNNGQGLICTYLIPTNITELITKITFCKYWLTLTYPAQTNPWIVEQGIFVIEPTWIGSLA